MVVRSASKERLLEAGLDLLSREAVNGVAKLLSPEALQKAASNGGGPEGGVSRHTAYRLWGTNRRQAVADLANHVVEVNLNDASELFAQVMEAHAKAVRDLELRGQLVVNLDLTSESVKASLRNVVRLIFEWQLEAAVVPAGWALQSAALTSSPLWHGTRPDPATEDYGRQVLAARAAFYTAVTEQWTGVLESLLALWGRRPRAGVTVTTLVQMMSALMDGSLLRLFVDPNVNDEDLPDERREEILQQTISLVSDTISDMVWTYTEHALVDDPRRPDPVSEELHDFDQLVEAATELYADATDTVTPTDAANKADISPAAASRYFPDAGDLADSVLRRLIVPSGLDLSISQVMNPTPLIELMLRRLRQAADTHPTPIRVAQTQPPTHPEGAQPLLTQLHKALTNALHSPKVNCPDPAQTAFTMIDMTLNGYNGWKAVEAILAVYAVTKQ